MDIYASSSKLVPITDSEKEEIDAFWNQFMKPEVRDKLVDYRYYEMFKYIKREGERLSHFIPETFYYSYVDDYFSNPQRSKPCDDKNLYDLFLHDIHRPKTIFRKIDGMYLDEHYNDITLNDAIKKCKDCEEVILKPGKFTGGGKGIIFWKPDVDSEETLKEYLQQTSLVTCQEVIKQHPLLNELNATSINTVRPMTLVYNNQVHLLSSFLRIGKQGSRFDNVSGGGMACGIMPDGKLKPLAYDFSLTKYTHHPCGKQFDGIVVPNYDKCIDMITHLAKRFATISKLISWDIAIDDKGEPLLIEFNVSFGGLNFHQICNGPVFGDMTEEIMKEVFDKSFTLNSIIKSFKN